MVYRHDPWSRAAAITQPTSWLKSQQGQVMCCWAASGGCRMLCTWQGMLLLQAARPKQQLPLTQQPLLCCCKEVLCWCN
jgi:hypothetical protein